MYKKRLESSGKAMSKQVTYSEARANLASLWDEAESTREPIMITRRGKEKMALLPASELSSLEETVHLLRSPRNAARLFAAMERARAGEGTPIDIDELRKQFGL
jgi:antitoxin YefM